MYCRFCGKELPEEALFCPHCGNAQIPAENGEEPQRETPPRQEQNSWQGAQQPNCAEGQYNAGQCNGEPYNNATQNNGAGQQYNGYYSAQQGGNYPPYPPHPYPNPSDIYSGGWIALGLFIPLVGLILYLVWQAEYPNRARACGKGALIGFIVNVSVAVLAIIISFIVIGIAAAAGPYYAAGTLFLP